MKKLAIVIVNYNTKKLTLDCIKSIKRDKTNKPFDIIVVDNGSTDNTIHEVRKTYPSVIIISSPKNLGFAKGNNLALKKYCKSYEYFLLLNSDTLIEKNAIVNLLNFSESNGFGISSCRLVDKNGKFQPNAGKLPRLLNVFFWISGLDGILSPLVNIPSYHLDSPGFYNKPKKVGWVSGSVMLINSTLFNKIGYMDENIFMYGEDVEYCLRASLHTEVGWTNKATIVHFGGASSPDPKFSQWLGEFKGLKYIYKKHYKSTHQVVLNLFIKLFILARVVVFWLVGKKEYAKTYAKILKIL